MQRIPQAKRAKNTLSHGQFSSALWGLKFWSAGFTLGGVFEPVKAHGGTSRGFDSGVTPGFPLLT